MIIVISLLREGVCVVAHARRNGGGGRWSLTIATEQRTVLGDGTRM